MEKEIDFFLTVATCGSISKAADLLFISQPALSRCIGNLENKLNQKLFIRTLAGIELTEAGKVYLEYAKEVKSLDSTMRFRMKHIADKKKKQIRIGMSLTVASLLATRIADEVMKRYPETIVEIYNIYARDISSSLRDERYDFVIAPSTFLSAEEQIDSFQNDYYLIAVPNRYHIEEFVLTEKEDGSFPYVRLEDLPAMDFVFQDKKTSVRKDIENILRKHGLTITPILELTSTSLVLQAVEAGAGCCFVVLGHIPYAVGKNVRFYRIDTDYRAETGVIIRRGKILSEEEEYSITCIKHAIHEGQAQLIQDAHVKTT